MLTLPVLPGFVAFSALLTLSVLPGFVAFTVLLVLRILPGFSVFFSAFFAGIPRFAIFSGFFAVFGIFFFVFADFRLFVRRRRVRDRFADDDKKLVRRRDVRRRFLRVDRFDPIFDFVPDLKAEILRNERAGKNGRADERRRAGRIIGVRLRGRGAEGQIDRRRGDAARRRAFVQVAQRRPNSNGPETEIGVFRSNAEAERVVKRRRRTAFRRRLPTNRRRNVDKRFDRIIASVAVALAVDVDRKEAVRDERRNLFVVDVAQNGRRPLPIEPELERRKTGIFGRNLHFRALRLVAVREEKRAFERRIRPGDELDRRSFDGADVPLIRERLRR